MLWLPAEVMKKIKPLKLIIALSVGLSFFAIIILSYCSSTFNLRRLDGNYTGKKTLHLLAFKNAQGIPSSINERLRDRANKRRRPTIPSHLDLTLVWKKNTFFVLDAVGNPEGIR